ncbi:helix-turn-helix transcriptional regulator [Thiohalophilus sp.]|uniref:helix-turn-helix domain-containing protein n=1 Tax=Thiohalophilus sp. TaxID=3028392 RepID=UPI002ACE72AA|nr:helix-turn-helix transcriptional regulator [Thiohalophilus sp.]MDZ7803143.1 helix-turn-helix transcriptional regulator [Thiohalophilus sp.]
MTKAVRNNRELGEAIRAARLGKNLRQVDVARKASLRQALISEMENGATSARVDTVFKVLAALELDLAIIPRHSAAFDPTDY